MLEELVLIWPILAHDMAHESVSMNTENYMKEWGVDMNYTKGGALADTPDPLPSPREIYLLKRSKENTAKTSEKQRVGFTVLLDYERRENARRREL